MSQDPEREGEEEEGVLNEEVVADEDLGALGVIPERTEVEETKEGENEEPEAEVEAEAEAEAEAETDPNDPVLKERRAYLRLIAAFFKERSFYYRNKRMPGGSAKLKAHIAFQRRAEELPSNATYSDDGLTLTLLTKAGKLKATIPMQEYRSPTHDELESLAAKRLQAIATAEKDYEVAIDELRQVYKTGIGGDIKRAQRQVGEADRRLHRIRYPELTLDVYKNVQIRQVDFEKPRDEHTTSVYAMHVATLKRQNAYAVPIESSEKEVAEPIEEIGKKQRTILFAAKPIGQYGFLSSFYANPFEYKGVEYPTAYHAIMSLIAHKFGDDDRAEEIRETEDPADIDLTWDKLEGVTHKAWDLQLESLIIKVNRAKFVKDPALGAKLLKTGDARIAAVPPENETDPFQGIGLTEENPDAKKKSKWKGKNVFGLALEQIREELMAKEPKTTVVKEPVAAIKESAKPKKLVRRLIPLSATTAVTDGAAVVAQGASTAAATVAQGASTAAATVAQGASAAAATVVSDVGAVANAATKAASATSDVVAQGAAAATNAITKGASAAADAASATLASGAAAILKAVSPS